MAEAAGGTKVLTPDLFASYFAWAHDRKSSGRKLLLQCKNRSTGSEEVGHLRATGCLANVLGQSSIRHRVFRPHHKSIDRVSTQTRTGPVPTPPGRAHQRGRASVHAGPAQLSDRRTHTWLAGLTCGERGEVPCARTRTGTPSLKHYMDMPTQGL